MTRTRRPRNDARYRRALEQKRCTRLNCKRKSGHTKKCERHAERDREIQRRRRESAVGAGLCTKCCRRAANASPARCRRCQAQEARYRARRVAQPARIAA